MTEEKTLTYDMALNRSWEVCVRTMIQRELCASQKFEIRLRYNAIRLLYILSSYDYKT